MADGTPTTRKDARGDLPSPRVFTESESWVEDLAAVNKELQRVLDRFGAQSLTLFDWASVLGEEYGEVCKAINDYEFGTSGESDLRDVYKEAIQVAAVAVHMAAVIRQESDAERSP